MNLQISVHRSCWRPSDERVTGWELFICAESSSWHRDSGTCPGFSCLPRQFFLAAVFSAGLSLSGDSVHHLSEWRHSCVSVCRGWRVCGGWRVEGGGCVREMNVMVSGLGWDDSPVLAEADPSMEWCHLSSPCLSAVFGLCDVETLFCLIPTRVTLFEQTQSPEWMLAK